MSLIKCEVGVWGSHAYFLTKEAAKPIINSLQQGFAADNAVKNAVQTDPSVRAAAFLLSKTVRGKPQPVEHPYWPFQ